ncbi:hypothetical protein HYY75_00365 [bacterium]|nr:hypothetical protein [bacterium]
MIFLLMFFIVFFLLLTYPATGYKSAALYASRAACYSNIRQIRGELEMLYMDASGTPTWIGSDGKFDFKCLHSRGELKPTLCRFNGLYEGGLITSDTVFVFCTFHGDIDENRVPGQLDPGYSSVYWLWAWFRGIFRGKL